MVKIEYQLWLWWLLFKLLLDWWKQWYFCISYFSRISFIIFSSSIFSCIIYVTFSFSLFRQQLAYSFIFYNLKLFFYSSTIYYSIYKFSDYILSKSFTIDSYIHRNYLYCSSNALLHNPKFWVYGYSYSWEEFLLQKCCSFLWRIFY